MPRVIVSSGHTSASPGSTANGLREADLAKKIARSTLKYLRQNGIISLSVPPEMELADRIKWINETGYQESTNDLALEIHINDGGKSGIEIWYEGEGDNVSHRLADSILTATVTETKLPSQGSKSEYQLTLQSTDTQALYEQAPRLADELAKSPSVADVTTDVQLNNPEIGVQIDRDRAAQLGVSVQAIEETLYSAYGSRQVSTIFAPTNSYSVILELDPRTQRDPSALSQLYVRSDAGALVPLPSVASIESRVGPLSVNHSGQLPAATVSFNVRAGHSLSEAIDAAEQAARRVLPENVSTSFQGSAEAFQSGATADHRPVAAPEPTGDETSTIASTASGARSRSRKSAPIAANLRPRPPSFGMRRSGTNSRASAHPAIIAATSPAANRITRIQERILPPNEAKKTPKSPRFTCHPGRSSICTGRRPSA